MGENERANRVLRGAIIDGAILGGALLISYGAWLIHPPTGLIAAGVLLLAFGLAGVRR